MSMEIPEDKIREVIWKWWENIQRIEAEYDVKISIADDGITTITASNGEWWNKAIEEIKQILWIPEVGYKDTWKVIKIIDWIWAIIEYKWKNSWMIHISKLDSKRVEKIEDVVKLWDSVEFEIIQVDLAKGRVGLKRKFETKKQEK
jgi:polyribonucleotide nucleotidyltransferase